jgi:hypothetical protein
MKFALIAIAMTLGQAAMAHGRGQDCTPYLVSPSGSEGEFHYVYPCGDDHTVTHRACKEGEVAYDSVLDPSGNFYRQVPVVCHNGTFAPGYTGDVPHRGCREGEISYGSELDPSGNFYQQVTLVCRNGTFVPARRR